MNNLIQLAIRHGLAYFAGFLATHHITGDSTSAIVTSILMMIIASVWSWVAKLWHIDGQSGDVTSSEALRSLIGALVSQGVTFASAALATNADDPEALAVALVNMGISKAGLTQKLAFIGAKDALKLFLLSAFSFQLCSCSSFTRQDAINYGERVGLASAETAILLAHMQLASAEADLNVAMSQPGAKKSEIAMKRLAVSTAQQALNAATRAIDKRRGHLDAKQPRDVTSSKAEDERAESRNADCEEPCGPDATPGCLKIFAIPAFNTRVGLKNDPSGSNAEAASSSQSRVCGLLHHSPLWGAPNCAACHARASVKQTATVKWTWAK